MCLHVYALSTYPHVFGLVMSCICLCLQASRAVDVSAYNGWYPNTHIAERVSAFFTGLYWGHGIFGFYQELQICLLLLVCMDSWACVCMCLHMLRAGYVSSYVGRYQEHSMFLHVSRAGHVSACVYQELSEYLHVLAFIKSWVCLPQVFVLIESWASTCMLVHIEGCTWFSKCGPVSRAEKVSACVGAHLGLAMIQHVVTCVGSWACICTRSHFSRAGYATSCVCMCLNASFCYMEWSI